MADPVTITDQLVLDATPARIRALLEDVPLVVACIPGAAVSGDATDGAYPAKIGVQYGETGVRLSGTVRSEWPAIDAAVVRAEGQDKAGTVRATGEIRITVGAQGADGTRVEVAARFTFGGILAPLARSATRIVGPQLMRSFARCLSETLASRG
ncbi:MAG TPA: SRPBCC domain-containing protein [Candidatus Limnocylindria bacterium]|nr:SRPBCC domain-containing protein [Candidatus Limnocylindria bacterium]